jgi:hypothetical protein
MNARRPVRLERLQHLEGQMLRSRDFRDRARFDEELLAWHQRALHDAFGVVIGLEVTEDEVSRTVVVAPGVAYDCSGRPIILAEEHTVELPPSEPAVARTLVLRRRRAGQRGELCWLAGRRPDRHCGVRLAHHEGPTLTVRPGRAHPLARPRIGWGETSPGATAWVPWLPFGAEAGPRGIEVRIDTSAFGFTTPPCYFAWLRWPQLTSPVVFPLIYRMLAVQFVQDTAVDGFTFQALMPRPEGESISASASGVSFARRRRLSVCWIGIQGDHAVATTKGAQRGHLR